MLDISGPVDNSTGISIAMGATQASQTWFDQF